ncbi:MAG: hypothetical protein HYX67_09765, partial [Candidatus Melainabacteria bacterium]|nr:hypothetical protein [Candidatus Melainabacteria bacterium]
IDFSTQWLIDQQRDIHHLGATICQNDAKGQYEFNLVGEERALFQNHHPHLLKHKEVVLPLLQKMAARGYFGNVGIDAMVYKESDAVYLHPVVEINARKTMGYAALLYQQRNFPQSQLRFAYSRGVDGLLPHHCVQQNGKVIRFQRNVKSQLQNFSL